MHIYCLLGDCPYCRIPTAISEVQNVSGFRMGLIKSTTMHLSYLMVQERGPMCNSEISDFTKINRPIKLTQLI